MKKFKLLQISLLVLVIAFSFACTNPKTTQPTTAPTEVKNPEWAKNAVIYEVNIRQFSKEGTINGFTNDMQRLKELGVDILWIMPFQPIGVKNKKGLLGSYYSIRDYKAVNPAFGNLDDFKNMVKKAHELGMKLIIDWVPNHTSHDNNLIVEHPEYYERDSAGNLISPFDWTDVAQLNYKNPGLRKYMVETMLYWLKETDIDGFRCDVASKVPTDFWDSCRVELDKVKPIFMLAEADIPAQQKKAFDMSYDWKFHHIMNGIAKGKLNANSIEKHINWVDTAYPKGAILMEFTSNHDENSWSGTEFERLGEGAQTFAVIAATVPGMMLIYNGQEAAFNRRLKFFEVDPIDWGTYAYTPFYQQLIKIKKGNEALWNGAAGGTFNRIALTDTANVIAFVRKKDNDKVVVLANLTGKPRTIMVRCNCADGTYTDAFSGEQSEWKQYDKFSLKPWEYKVLESK